MKVKIDKRKRCQNLIATDKIIKDKEPEWIKPYLGCSLWKPKFMKFNVIFTKNVGNCFYFSLSSHSLYCLRDLWPILMRKQNMHPSDTFKCLLLDEEITLPNFTTSFYVPVKIFFKWGKQQSFTERPGSGPVYYQSYHL